MNKLYFLLLILYNVIWAQRRPPLQVSYFFSNYISRIPDRYFNFKNKEISMCNFLLKLNWKIESFAYVGTYCRYMIYHLALRKPYVMHVIMYIPGQANLQFILISAKFRIFDQFCSNFQGLIHSWCGQSLKVWAKL